MVLAALAACGKKDDKKQGGEADKPKAATASDDDCDKLGAKTSTQSMENTPPGVTDDQRAKLKALSDEAGKAVAKRCKDDDWTAEAVVCGLRSSNPQVECDGKLTAEQKQKMTADVQAVFSRAIAADPALVNPPGTPQAGTPPPSAPPPTEAPPAAPPSTTP